MSRVVAPKYRFFNRRILLLALLCLAGGFELFFGPARWQDLCRWTRQGREALLGLRSLTQSSPLVRGAIYDRYLRELAVSYASASIQAQPSLIRDALATAQQLARILEVDAESLLAWLKEGGRLALAPSVITPARAQDIEQLSLPGIEVRFGEDRYYPRQKLAAQLLGYVEQRFGLTGVESRYDSVLQPGVYRCSELPQLDCQDSQTPGSLGSDVVLTVDLEVQHMLEELLASQARESGMIRGGALVMEADSGAVQAMVSLPNYDLNRYWLAEESQQGNMMLEQVVPVDASRSLLHRAASGLWSRTENEDAVPLLVAAPEFVSKNEFELQRLADMIGLYDPYACDLPQRGDEGTLGESESKALRPVSPLQLATAVARMVNSGSPVEPHLLAGVYDRHDGRYFLRRKRQPASLAYIRTLPARETGRIVREFQRRDVGQAVAMHSVTSRGGVQHAGSNKELRLVDVHIGLVPARSPRMVLLAVMERAPMLPAPKSQHQGGEKLAGQLRALALRFHAMARPAELGEAPPPPDPALHAVYLTEQRLYRREEGKVARRSGETAMQMPSVVDMSLRRGLRQLSGRNLLIRVNGSGRIVSQQPPAGTRLEGVTECQLVLKPEV